MEYIFTDLDKRDYTRKPTGRIRMNDKIIDILFVLNKIFNEINGSNENIKVNEVRLGAVKNIAKTELENNRFKDFRSAKNSIHDACVRRLRPNISKVTEFDQLIELWINQNSSQLQDILIKHATNDIQRHMISDFFKRTNQ